MKVLLINGSPHKKGCTNRALKEVSETLNKEGIDTEKVEKQYFKDYVKARIAFETR